MSELDSSDEMRISQAAADWIVRHDRGLTPAEQDEFHQWLTADPRHRLWFAQQRATWSDFNLLAQWRPEHSEEPNPDLLATRARFRWRGWGLVGLAAAAGVAVLLSIREPTTVPIPPPSSEVATAQGYERRILEDGSIVELNRGAQVVVKYTPRRRTVSLTQGEAQFTVAKNPQRPFVVSANGVRVRAVGTAFNVRVATQAVEVFVTEGKVQLNQVAASASAETETPSAAVQETAFVSIVPELIAGQRTVVSLAPNAAAPVIEAISPEDMARLLSWQPQLLDFSSTPLREVVSEFNRRNRLQLIVADPELNNVPIVASFRSDNVDGFVRLLEITAGVRAERRGEREIVLHQGP